MPHLGESFFDENDLSSIGFRRIGRNVRIKKNAGLFFVENISLGNNIRIDDFTIIVASREPVSIGDNVHIAAHCYLSASDGLSLGDYCGLAPGVSIFTSSDDYGGERMTNVTLPKQFTGGPARFTQLGRHAIVGAHSVILPGANLGEGVAVGAQSLVTRPLAPWGVYAGVPARRLKDRSRHLLEHERAYLATVADGSDRTSEGADA